MKKIPAIAAALVLLACLDNAPALAKAETPATHMWIRTGTNSIVYVPVHSLEQCALLTAQAAEINSSDSVCYNGEQRLQKTNCQKAVKRGEGPRCNAE